MELSMPTIVIRDLYQNAKNHEFSLTLNEVSWYGMYRFIKKRLLCYTRVIRI